MVLTQTRLYPENYPLVDPLAGLQREIPLILPVAGLQDSAESLSDLQ